MDAGLGESAAEIDRCDRCGGLFLEFFDGEPGAISRRVAERRDFDSTHAPGHPERPLTCPDCAQAMVLRAYLGEGPELPRCETCMAVFLTPELREAMSRLELSRAEEEEPSWLDRLLGWLE